MATRSLTRTFEEFRQQRRARMVGSAAGSMDLMGDDGHRRLLGDSGVFVLVLAQAGFASDPRGCWLS